MTTMFTNSFSVLNTLFEKKKCGREPLTQQEASLVSRLRYSALIRRIIDPSVSFALPEEDYTPGQMELDMAFFAVTGRPAAKGESVALMFRTVGMALECAENLERLYFGQDAKQYQTV